MLFGLVVALGWGLADLGAAIAGKRIGSFRTLLIAQASSVVLLVVVIPLTGTAIVMPLEHLWIAILDSILAVGAYLCLYRSLELGPVALVSPIAAAYAAITILLAVLILGEQLSAMAITGIAASLVGVVFASTDLRELFDRGKRLAGPGVPWALAALALFGVGTYVFAWLAQLDDWAGPSLVARVTATIVLGAAFLLTRRRRAARAVKAPDAPESHPLDRKGLAIAAGTGAVDVAGVAVFAIGSHRAPISIVTAASVAWILIPVFGGIFLFRERPTWSQLAGVALVALGLVLLGLGS